jgi:hypothetical protein
MATGLLFDSDAFLLFLRRGLLVTYFVHDLLYQVKTYLHILLI